MSNLSPAPMPAPAGSGSRKWILFGALGCLAVLVIGGCILSAILIYLARTSPAPRLSIITTGALSYTNDEARLTPDLRADFVPFTFTYPGDWVITARGDTPGDSNFVEVQRAEGDKMVENFAVGSFNGSGNLVTDRGVAATLAEQFSQQFAAATADYHQTSSGPVTVTSHRYDAYQFLFSALAKDAETHTNSPLFGRVILVSGGNAGHAKGVILLLTATDKSGITSPDQLGESDDLAVILNTFVLTR